MHLQSIDAWLRTRPYHAHISRMPSKSDLKTHSGARRRRAKLFGVYKRILGTGNIYFSNANARRHTVKALSSPQFY